MPAATSTTFQFSPSHEGLRLPDSLPASVPFHFNSCPLCEGLPAEPLRDACFDYFNSRPRERGFVATLALSPFLFNISIHAPREGLHSTSMPEKIVSYFNSRPCERGFTESLKDLGVVIFQFTPLREGFQQKSNNFGSIFCCFYSLRTFFQNKISNSPN